MVKLPDYPKELKAAEWEKNKGTATKLKSESGLGLQLKKAESDYVRVEKMHHDNQIALCNTSTQITKVGDACLQVLIVFRKTIGEVEKLADKVAAEYKKSAIVGSTTRKYVESIAAAAKENGKFMTAVEAAHEQFLKACMDYYKQPSIIGGDILLYMKETQTTLPKLKKVLEALQKIKEEDRIDPLKKFCSSLKKFAVETPRSCGVALLEYADKAKDSEVAELAKLWGEPGKVTCHTLEESSRFISDVEDAYKTSLPVLKKKGFRV